MARLTILIFFFLFSGNLLFAQGIKLLEDKSWAEVKAIAAHEKKMIFLDAYATWCGPCVYMQKHVFTDPEAGKYFNANFINVKIDMEKGEGPALSEAFDLTAYPTLYFFSPEGKMLHKHLGALETEDFIAMAKDIQIPENQYYTQKELALTGKLNPELFHNWIHLASDFEEEDLETVITTYLNQITDLTKDAHTAIIALDHTTSLTSIQLKQLNQYADKLAELAGATKEAVIERLREKQVY